MVGGTVEPLIRFAAAFVLNSERGRSALWPAASSSYAFGGWLGELLILAGAVALLGLFMASRPRVSAAVGGEDVDLVLPAFLCGIVPLKWGIGLLPTYWAFRASEGWPSGDHLQLAALFVGGLILLFSWPAFHLFSSLPRLRSNLVLDPAEPGVELSDSLAGRGATLRRQAVKATVVLVVAGVVTAGLLWIWSFSLPRLVGGATGVLMALALGLDLVAEARFRRAHPTAGRLLEMDNVHLASLLRARLEEEGVPCLVQSWNFRSLFFFLGPLYKMQLLVPADAAERAREIVQPEALPRV